MEEWVFGRLALQLVQGDITDQTDLHVVVNAANAQLTTGGGVAGAIHRKAGPELEAACRPLAPISPGQAVMTKGFGLPNQHVIHCLGPVYGVDQPSDQLLASCYEAALKLADQAGLSSIGFPAISTGIFAYPIREAAGIAIQSTIRQSTQLENVTVVRFVLFSESDFSVFREILKGMA